MECNFVLSAVDYILEGLAKALESERECGLRSVEIDRTLLKVEEKSAYPPSVSESRSDGYRGASPHPCSVQQPAASGQAQAMRTPITANHEPRTANHESYDFAFLHDRALSAGGIEMMAKIVTAMKKTPEAAPIVFTGERPKARVCVVLGDAAMKQWFPDLRGAPGIWLRSKDGQDVLVTYSPEYILRFGPVTPTVQKIKAEMWNSLKGVMQRVGRFG